MDFEEIADGKVRAINDKQAYILERIPVHIQDGSERLQDVKTKFGRLVAEYIYEVDYETALIWLQTFIEERRLLEIEYIFKPAHMIGILCQYGSLAVKFDRLPDDQFYFDDQEDEDNAELTTLSEMPKLLLKQKKIEEITPDCGDTNQKMTNVQKHFSSLPEKAERSVIFRKYMADDVNHPTHYQGKNGMESIDVIENFDLGFNLGNAIKYVLRAGKKEDYRKDLMKAMWYLQRELDNAS